MSSAGRRRSALASLALAIGALLLASPAAACEVCYGRFANGSPMVSAARLGVLLLLGVTVTVLGGFAKFFFYLRRRAREAEFGAIDSEWSQFQRSPIS